MRLSKKTFVYSMLLAGIMVAFIVGYFTIMLPSLYVKYVTDSNYNSVVEVQKKYVDQRTYDNIAVKNPTATYSVEIPNEGSKIYVAGTFFKLTVDVRDEDLQELLNGIRDHMANWGEGESWEQSSDFQWEKGNEWEELFAEKFSLEDRLGEDYPVSVQIEGKEGEGVYQEEYEKFHMEGNNLVVYEGGVSDENYGYTTYVAMTRAKDALIVTIMPTMTPRMDEITPVVMGSLPMIIAVVFLLILIASRFFSGKIVNPIIRLAGYAEGAKLAEHFEVEAFEAKGTDEIGDLGRAIQELYEKLRDQYLVLEQTNHALEEENVRQEVFLRASAHQLKTPVSAALLLVEGMINEVGKYKNTREYLPEVKSQLLSMKRIVEDILYLNYRIDHMEKEDVRIELLVKELVEAYTVQAESRRLEVKVKGEGSLLTDREMLKKIIDNLLSNAVCYTPEGEKIEIQICPGELCIRNYGTVIEEKLLPNIFDPFVSSDPGGKGKGLGLYVASYYGRLMGCRLTVENQDGCVCAKLFWKEKKKGEE